jgi:hypothetical protein
LAAAIAKHDLKASIPLGEWMLLPCQEIELIIRLNYLRKEKY